MPKISVLIPIYNVEKYLKECLDSIVNQTLQDIEIICINDGSTDSSLQILESYKGIKIINKENSGYGDSMNKGLEVATGEYIGIVESDDFIKNTMFEDLYNLAIKDDADLVKSDFFEYTTANNLTRKAGKLAGFKKNVVINAKKYPKLLEIQPSIWSAIYKRDFLNENNIRFLPTPGASYQDTSFAFKTMALAKKVVLTDNVYLYYRQDNLNSSVKSKGKVFTVCDEFDEITDFLNKNPEVKAFANNSKLIKQFGTYMWRLKRVDEAFRDELIERFAETFIEFDKKGELTKDFYKHCNKAKLQMLFNNREKFRIFVDKAVNKKERKENRQKIFSVHINSSRISVVIFGKQIIGN